MKFNTEFNEVSHFFLKATRSGQKMTKVVTEKLQLESFGR